MIYFISGIFVLVIILLVLYIKNLLKMIYSILEDIDHTKILFKEFSEHLESIYKMELFYGEPVLLKLLDHSKEVNEYMKDFNEYYDNFNDSNRKENQEDMINNE